MCILVITQFVKDEKIEFIQGLTSFGKKGYGGPCTSEGTLGTFSKFIH